MINNEDFIERLQKVIDYYGESASSFAEKIGVQRSSISHILSGRNKPSLDFILKVLHTFPDVDLYWLFNGKGYFPSETTKNEKAQNNIPDKAVAPSAPPQTNRQIEIENNEGKSIERIVIFYSDGTFKNFKN
ncbi:helix-turn-helix transcriptional regulator [Tamlana crocina]|uniref:Helix-turn-helix transcriptional regulator n=1 Tax=Tamlana crocina TaxID=393006 RepID=A0ABX1DBZ8_9FLAO|nr:helix-turn-helix transcriptional regulator [Tamlana crocina]NJX15184.1 helix-turn-helix transcriptional regulator [Tamlana crocina]